DNQALDIALHITLGLEYAHSQGVIHGLLRPENIFLTADGVKLGDFGLGRLIEGRTLLNAPLLHLSPTHLAPEQILGHPFDARTDLYALCVIFYQLFTGQLPFTGSPEEIMQAHLQHNPRPPRELNPQLSPFLEHLILKLMAKSPNDRYTSVEQAYRIYSSLLSNIGEAKHQHRKPLIGREKQLQLLQACWAEARAGRGQLVLISGEPGIGKSSLASHAVAQFNPPVLLIGRCQEREGSAAYHPFSEMLRGYFATVPPELLDQEIHPFLANFAQLVPELQQLLPDLPEPPPLEPKQEQLRLISNLTQFIKQATQRRPWLLLLDDLQWADQSSLELLHYLSHHLPSLALLIIGTYHDTEVEPGHPLLELLRNLSDQAIYHHLPLGRLAQADLEQILADIWQQPAPAALIEKIYQRTDGNPLYVEEVAKGLVDGKLITWHEGKFHFPELDEIQLPKTVRDAVWRRIDQLSPETLLLLRQAAVLGQSFKFEELQAISGLSEWDVLEGLDVALARQLVQEIPGESQLRFSQAEIRQVIYSDMGILRRRLLHRQAGEALERQAMPEPEQIAEKLAYHFGEAGEFERALVYSIQAARRAELAWANETAIRWYKQTLTVLDGLEGEAAAQFQPLRISTHQCLGQALTLVGRYEEALAHIQHSLALAVEQGNLLDQGISQRLLGQVHLAQPELALAETALQQSLQILTDLDNSYEAAKTKLVLVRLALARGSLDQAKTYLDRARPILVKLEAKVDLLEVETLERELTTAQNSSRD
ncbi:MAG TPA: AAA family ATPase, partial [Anaerolineae bacterium]|nr:AAA family ATPase [Anaerolineae bacterium]